jgi:hypothetical protein
MLRLLAIRSDVGAKPHQTGRLHCETKVPVEIDHSGAAVCDFVLAAYAATSKTSDNNFFVILGTVAPGAGQPTGIKR